MATNQAIKDMLWDLEDDIAMLASVYHDVAKTDNDLTRKSLHTIFWNELCGIIQRLREISDTI